MLSFDFGRASMVGPCRTCFKSGKPGRSERIVLVECYCNAVHYKAFFYVYFVCAVFLLWYGCIIDSTNEYKQINRTHLYNCRTTCAVNKLKLITCTVYVLCNQMIILIEVICLICVIINYMQGDLRPEWVSTLKLCLKCINVLHDTKST